MNKRWLKYLLPAAMWVCAIILSSATKDEPVKFVQPQGWPKSFYNAADNHVTDAGFALGRRLFYDLSLSGNGRLACASCHRQQDGFASAGLAINTGVNGPKGKRNTPTLANLAWNTSFMWDGGVNNLEVQPLAPITSDAEMGTTLDAIVHKLNAAPSYRAAFYKTFGDSSITGQRVLKAFAQFMVMLESYNSKYDRYMRHERDVTFSKQELSGLSLFRSHCSSCHSEPLFSNYSFQYTGLKPDPNISDNGRYGITHACGDSLKFKVPSLRNVGVSAPYMHDGRFTTLMQALDHYTKDCNDPLAAPSLRHLILSVNDKKDLIAFMNTLTDTSFLDDTRFKE